MRDAASSLNPINAFTTVGASAADADGAIIDTQGYEELTFVFAFGAEAYTANASNYVELVVKHGNDSGLSDVDIVPASDQVGTWETPASAVYKRLDAAGDSPAVYEFGVKASKRYVRVSLNFEGTVTGGIPVAGIALLGGALHNPAGVTQAP